MGNRRIYLGRELSKYAKIASGAIITVTSLFFVLMVMGFEITGSDDVCLGTLEDPCVSYGKICNLGPDNFDIYNPDEVKMDCSPTIKDSWMFFKDGRVRKQFLYEKGINASTSGWRYENFTDATKPRSDRVYVHRFARYSCQDYMLVGLKENPDDLIKWGFGVGKEYLDPFWYGVNDSATTLVSGNISVELGTPINFTTNLTGATTTCVDIDHPDYGDNYSCGSPTANFTLNISYFRETEFNDSSIENNLSFIDGGNQTLYIASHQYDKPKNLSFNITGYSSNGTYPTNLNIYINDTLVKDVGVLFGGDSFSDSDSTFYGESSQVNLTFISAGYLEESFFIPANANIDSATFDMEGFYDESRSFCDECSDVAGFYCTGGRVQNPCSNANDSSWQSYSASGSSCGWVEIIANYTKPTGVKNNSIYRISAANLDGNYNIPDACWTGIDELAFWSRIQASCSTQWSYLYCWNGSGWTLMDSNSGSSYNGYFYEEAMNWSKDYAPLNPYISIGTSSKIEKFDLYNSSNFVTGDELEDWIYSHVQVTKIVGAQNTNWYGNTTFGLNISEVSSINISFVTESIYNVNDKVYVNEMLLYVYNYTYNKFDLVSNYTQVGDPGSPSTANVSYYIPTIPDDFKSSNNMRFYFSINYYDSSPSGWSSGGSLALKESKIDAEANQYDWYYEGEYNFSNSTDLTTSINTYLTVCEEDADGYCSIPIYFGSSSLGTLQIDNMSINYSYNPNPVEIDKTIIESFLDASFNFTNIPIIFGTSSNGTIKVEDLKYDHIGGNDTIEIFAFEQGDESNNQTFNLFIYASRFFKNLPYTWTENIFFLPKTKDSKNVTAYGQSSVKPTYNITTINYGNKNANISIRVNETITCLNLSWAIANFKNESTLLTTSWIEIGQSLDYLSNIKLWFWADLNNCNASERLIINPQVELESYCEDCYWDE